MKIDLVRFGKCKTPAEQAAEFVKATAKAVKGLRIMQNRILVGTYVQRAVSAGGIIMPEKTLDESRFQGKAGVILAMGPLAFHFKENEKLLAEMSPLGRQEFMRKHYPQVGEWVFYRASDTWEIALGEGAPCRFIYDDVIVGRITDPEFIW